MNNGGETSVYYSLIFLVISIAIISLGCDKGAPVKAVKQAPPPVVQQAVVAPAASSTDLDEDGSDASGYIYNQRGRRDPFIPLIVPTKPVEKKGIIKSGTLEGYDISEFVLSAIARKGKEYFALVVSPDNKSFTIYKGTVIGLNRGKVKAISGDKVVLVEHSRDFKGELRPRQIILEFPKGETEQ